MAALRRQLLSAAHQTDGSPDLKKAGTIREAFALAAAAAESKGVSLHPAGLKRYAQAMSPEAAAQEAAAAQETASKDAADSYDTDHKQHRERGQRDQRDHTHDGQDQEKSLKVGSISAFSVMKTALETAENDPLLAILNKLPGKNKLRWIVLPFSFYEGNRKFNVSLKILLESEKQAAGFMSLDISEHSSAEQSSSEQCSVEHYSGMRSSLYTMDFSSGGAARLFVYLQPGLARGKRASFTGELSRLMGIPPERISVMNRTESVPFAAARAAADIDEAV